MQFKQSYLCYELLRVIQHLLVLQNLKFTCKKNISLEQRRAQLGRGMIHVTVTYETYTQRMLLDQQLMWGKERLPTYVAKQHYSILGFPTKRTAVTGDTVFSTAHHTNLMNRNTANVRQSTAVSHLFPDIFDLEYATFCMNK